MCMSKIKPVSLVLEGTATGLNHDEDKAPIKEILITNLDAREIMFKTRPYEGYIRSGRSEIYRLELRRLVPDKGSKKIR